MLNALVAITAITQILVGLLVYQKKRHSITNITFGFISLTTLAWAVTNYAYTLNPTSKSALEIIRTILFFVVLQNAVFYIFAHNYPSDAQTIRTKKLFVFLACSVIVALATLSPYVFTSVTVSHGQSNPNPGPLIALFIAHALYAIGTGLRSFYKKISHAKGQLKKELQFIFFASILNWGVVPITNFVITLVFHTTFFAKVSPVYTLAFGGIIAYAIVAQRLFNIQAAVARSVGYFLTVVSLAAAYTISAFTVSSLLLGSHSVRVQTQIVYIVLALVLAISFQYVKKIFDHITNTLFYQDAYDPQELLNKLNRVLVTAVGLNELLSGTVRVIDNALKTEFCLVVLIVPGAKAPRIVGTAKKSFSSEDLAQAHSRITAARSHQQVIVTDYLGAEKETLKHLLAKNDIAALAQLSDNSRKNEKELGHIILGPKKSGNPYSAQDVRLMETIANELVIAIQNALRFEEIQQFNITLQQKVTEATHKLTETNTRLRQLDETKDDFISMASHQLRTPLTSVKGISALVLDGDAGEISRISASFWRKRSPVRSGWCTLLPTF